MSRREDRVELQEEDDGDPDDTVYIGVGHAGTHRCTTYHDSRQCLLDNGKSEDEILEKSRAFEKRGSKAPCKNCVLGNYGGSTQ